MRLRSLAPTLLAAALATAAADGDRASRLGDWIEVTGPRFSLLSTADEAATRRMAADLENLHGVLAALMGGEPEPVRPSFVYLLGSRRAFERLAPSSGRGAAPVSGFFRNGPDAGYLVVDASRAEEATRTLYHEYVHQLAADLLPGLPLWFDEGLAELYQSFRLAEGGAEIGRPAPEHLARLGHGRLLPLEDVLAVRHDSPLYTSSADKPLLYAQCWALVHALVLGDPPRAAATRRFLGRVRRGEDPHAAFAAELGDDLASLESEVAGYARKSSFRIVRVPTGVAADPAGYVVRTLSDAEAAAVVGDLLLSEEPPRDEAGAYLEAASAAQPPPALALSGLAVLAEHRARWAEALALHRRAAGPGASELVLLRGAQLELHRGDGPRAAASLARRALALQPGYGRVLETLAEALLAADEAGDEALGAASRAASLLPRDAGALHTLVEVLTRLGELDDAETAVSRSPALDAEQRARAISRLVAVRGNRVRRLLLDGRLDEVAPELAAMERQAPRSADPAAVASLVAELGASARIETLARRLRAAEGALAEGSPAVARELAAAVLAEAPEDGPLARAARALVDRVDGVPPTETAPAFVLPVVSEAEIENLNRLLAAGDLEAAAAVLEDLRVRVGAVAGWWIEPKLAEVRRAIRHNLFAEAYNRAIDLADDGRRAEAAALLEQALAADPDHPEAADARQLLGRLRK